MAASGKTTNYGLPLYNENDVTTWADFNLGMTDIDGLIKTATDSAATGNSKGDQALSTAEAANTLAQTAINTSNTALTNSQNATTIANNASVIAGDAQTDAHAALSAANDTATKLTTKHVALGEGNKWGQLFTSAYFSLLKWYVTSPSAEFKDLGQIGAGPQHAWQLLYAPGNPLNLPVGSLANNTDLLFFAVQDCYIKVQQGDTDKTGHLIINMHYDGTNTYWWYSETPNGITSYYSLDTFGTSGYLPSGAILPPPPSSTLAAASPSVALALVN